MKKVCTSLDVWFSFYGNVKTDTCVKMTPQEAFNVLMMPAFSGFISSMVPNYELPAMPEKEG